MQRAAKDILAAGIGSKQMNAAFGDPKQMSFKCQGFNIDIKQGTGQIPFDVYQAVSPALDEKFDITPLGAIHCCDPAEICLNRALAGG